MHRGIPIFRASEGDENLVRKLGEFEKTRAKLVRKENDFWFEKQRFRKIGVIDVNVFCLLISQNNTSNIK